MAYIIRHLFISVPSNVGGLYMYFKITLHKWNFNGHKIKAYVIRRISFPSNIIIVPEKLLKSLHHRNIYTNSKVGRVACISLQYSRIKEYLWDFWGYNAWIKRRFTHLLNVTVAIFYWGLSFQSQTSLNIIFWSIRKKWWAFVLVPNCCCWWW